MERLLVLFPITAPFTDLALNRHGSRVPTGRPISAQGANTGDNTSKTVTSRHLVFHP
jgi:hypothetical protein